METTKTLDGEPSSIFRRRPIKRHERFFLSYLASLSPLFRGPFANPTFLHSTCENHAVDIQRNSFNPDTKRVSTLEGSRTVVGERIGVLISGVSLEKSLLKCTLERLRKLSGKACIVFVTLQMQSEAVYAVEVLLCCSTESCKRAPKEPPKPPPSGDKGEMQVHAMPSGKQIESSVKISLQYFVAGAIWYSKLQNSAISLSSNMSHCSVAQCRVTSCCEDRNGFYPRCAAERHGATGHCDIIIVNLTLPVLPWPSVYRLYQSSCLT